jgi:hypothetical protein
MAARSAFLLIPLIAAICAGEVRAFRACDVDNSDAYTASTQYVVGEIAFDPATGIASGTETTYNHSNASLQGLGECHVTYELTGSFESSSGTMVLDARRTNHSVSCSPEFIEASYPPERLYALLIELGGDGRALVHLADNGELIAQGEWSTGSTAYRTRETCSIF